MTETEITELEDLQTRNIDDSYKKLADLQKKVAETTIKCDEYLLKLRQKDKDNDVDNIPSREKQILISMIAIDQQIVEIKDMIYRHEASIKLIYVKMSSFLQDIVGIEQQLIKDFES